MLSLLGVALIFMQIKTADVWYDEIFSLKLASMSYKDIVAMTARDVHPPMYYWYLKLMADIFSKMGFVTACKLASVLPYIGMMILTATAIRKKYGWPVAGVFALLITGAPKLATYYVEIRMYSFCMFFLTLMFICLTDMIDKKKSKPYKWFVFFFCGMVVAYTQYYAFIGVVTLYLILIVCAYKSEDFQRRMRLGWVGMAISSMFLYLPWAPKLLAQVRNVQGGYWIQGMTWRSIPGTVKYMFMPDGTLYAGYVAAGLMAVAVVSLYILFFIKSKKGEDHVAVAGGIVLIAVTLLAGFVFTWMGHPIFVYRYMIPLLGVFYLGVAVAMDRCKVKAVKALAVCICLYLCYLSLKGFYWEEHKKVENYPHASELLESVPPKSMVITNFEQITALSAYYLKDCDAYIYGEFVTDPIIKDLFDNAYEMREQEVDKFILSGKYKEVYFFGTGNERDDFVNMWEQEGIDVELMDECLIERYWINIYRLSVDNEKH